MPIDYTTNRGKVRLLVNDVDEASGLVFTNAEIDAFLSLEGANVKRAAAQAIDTIADNEALASKVIRAQDKSTDGAKVADALRKRAAALRAQADRAEAEADDGGFFDIVALNTEASVPELTEWPGY